MSTIDTAEFRQAPGGRARAAPSAVGFLERRTPGASADELGELAKAARTTTSATRRRVTFDRELDEGLEEGAQQTLVEIDAALAAHRGRHATASASGAASRSAQSASPRSVGATLHRRPAAAQHFGRRRSERRRFERRRRSSPTSGSARRRTGWRRCRSRSARSPPGRGSGPAWRRSRSRRSMADQVTKHVVTRTLRARRGGRTSSGRSRSTTCRTPASPSGSSRARRWSSSS